MKRDEAIKDGWTATHQMATLEMFIRVRELLNQGKFEEAKDLANELFDYPLYWFSKPGKGIIVESKP